MSSRVFARVWFFTIFIQVAVVIPTRIVVEWQNDYGQFMEPFARSLNVLLYFTNISNMLVAGVSFLLFRDLKRTSFIFQVNTLTSLVSITVSSVVYWLMLAKEENLEGIDVYTNFVVHTSVPVMFIIGWILFMDHKVTYMKTIKYALIFPVGWAVFALVRGVFINWYPYPFMDVRDIGYATALVNMGVVTLFFLGLFFVAHFLDSKLPSKKLM